MSDELRLFCKHGSSHPSSRQALNAARGFSAAMIAMRFRAGMLDWHALHKRQSTCSSWAARLRRSSCCRRAAPAAASSLCVSAASRALSSAVHFARDASAACACSAMRLASSCNAKWPCSADMLRRA